VTDPGIPSAIKGSTVDLFVIHDQYYHRVKKFILASVKNESVADDLTQEAFIKIQEHLNTVRDPEKVSSWIFRIAYHLCQDHFAPGRNLQPRKNFTMGW